MSGHREYVSERDFNLTDLQREMELIRRGGSNPSHHSIKTLAESTKLTEEQVLRVLGLVRVKHVRKVARALGIKDVGV